VTFERVACKRVTYLTIIGLVMSFNLWPFYLNI